MWHSYTEMQMLLRLDFRATAMVRKDELVRTLWDKGDLKANVSEWAHRLWSGVSVSCVGGRGKCVLCGWNDIYTCVR